jgi:hypothetical protein
MPIVCPNNTTATLGNVIGDLRDQGWKLKYAAGIVITASSR